MALNEGAGSLLIQISSVGGHLPASFTAYNFLRSLPIPVTTYNLGEISSAAILLYLAGEFRLAAPTSSFMLHGVKSGAVPATTREIDALADGLKLSVQRYRNIFRERTQTGEVIVDIDACLAGDTVHLDAESAFKAGICTGPPGLVALPQGTQVQSVAG